MNNVSIVYRSRKRGCGIHLFSERLGSALSSLGFCVEQYNVTRRAFKPGVNTIVHYVPSMWAGDEGCLERILREDHTRNVIVILHGIYGPEEDAYLKETHCPELHCHMDALSSCARTIVALSNCSKAVWHQWDRIKTSSVDVIVIYHPGAPEFFRYNTFEKSYFFLGGIQRPKKDVAGDRLRNVLSAYSREGIRVWVHISNPSEEEVRLPVWRLTKGVLSDNDWFAALANAGAVLCPYETNIQCVSGVMAEAISVGTSVISTDFMFAREMKLKYPEMVHIEPDLLQWPVITYRTKYLLKRHDFPTWDDFAARIATHLYSC